MAVNVHLERGDKYAILTSNVILCWVNDILKTEFIVLANLSSGAAYCQLMDVLFPNRINLSLVKYEPTIVYEAIQNFKVLQECFQEMSVDWIIPIEELVTVRYYISLKFAQRFKKFFDVNYKDRIYDAIAVRRGAIIRQHYSFISEIPEQFRSGSGSLCDPKSRTRSMNATVEIQAPEGSREKQSPETSVEQLQIIEEMGKMQKNVLVPSSVIEPENSKDNEQNDVSLPKSSNKSNTETSVEQLYVNEHFNCVLVPSSVIKPENSMDCEQNDMSLPKSSNKPNTETSVEKFFTNVLLSSSVIEPENSVDNEQKPETSVEHLQIIEEIEHTGKMQKNVLDPLSVIEPENSMDNEQNDVSFPKSSHKPNPETSVEQFLTNVLLSSSVIEPDNLLDSEQNDVSLPKSSNKQNPKTSVEQLYVNEHFNCVLVPSSVIEPENSMDCEQNDVSLPESSHKPNPETSVEQFFTNVLLSSSVIEPENSMDNEQKPETSVEHPQIIEEIEHTGKMQKNVLDPPSVFDPENSMYNHQNDESVPKSSNKQNAETSLELFLDRILKEFNAKMQKNVLVPSSVIVPENSIDSLENDESLLKSINKQNPETSVEQLQFIEEIERTEKMQKNVLDPPSVIEPESSIDSQQNDVSLHKSCNKQNPGTSVEQLQFIGDFERTGKMQENVLIPSGGIKYRISMKKFLPKSRNKQNVFIPSARVNKKRKESKTQKNKSHQAELQKNLDYMQLQLDFYYSKCLRLEHCCEDPKGITSNKVLQDILFSTEDRYGPPYEA